MAASSDFAATIRSIVGEYCPSVENQVIQASYLLQYIEIKTRSANKGSKARGSFANLYALYVLVEDYVNVSKDDHFKYSDYKGAKFSELFARQRQLPFGEKLQNHALNHRLNEEFKKYFPTVKQMPIVRDPETNRYWINENLLRVTTEGKNVVLARPILAIIEAYIEAKSQAFNSFIATCEQLKTVAEQKHDQAIDFILSLLAPNIDARIFEIVSFSILKYYYHDQVVYFGLTRDTVTEERLKLYKTGRTNANDGGIDFVMKPLGRFFQVTETTDVRKYFLDIEKLERYPITFVVKSDHSDKSVLDAMKRKALETYGVNQVVDKYMSAIEEVINIPTLSKHFVHAIDLGYLPQMLEEIVLQSRIEFNLSDDS